MKLIDTVPFFLNQYHPSIEFLKSYYTRYPAVFKEYFSYHCMGTEERHKQSIQKYPQSFSRIEQVYKRIVPIINEVAEKYLELYGIDFPIEVNLIVGGFGSNAYTTRQIIPDITFCLERLSPELEHLKVIVAHEFGHAAHNILSDHAGMDWTKAKWNSPLIWAYQEGVATDFSQKIISGLHPSIYFSYDDSGYEWLSFAKENQREIKKAFLKEYETLTPDGLFKEWFSINGGRTFGFNRLAYYIGYTFLQSEIDRLGERDAIIAWKEADFEERIKDWLSREM